MMPGLVPLSESTETDWKYGRCSLAPWAMDSVSLSETRSVSLASVVRSLMTLVVVSVPLRFRMTPTQPAPAQDSPMDETCAWAAAATWSAVVAPEVSKAA